MISLRWPTTKNSEWNKPFQEKIAKRVSRIPTVELSSWAIQAMNDLGRCINKYEESREAIYLEEALVGAEALHAVVDELHKRSVVR